MYQVSIRPKVFKMLDKINEPVYSRIRAAIAALAGNPRPRGYKKLSGRPGYRIRVGDYRVIYEILDEVLVVEVIQLGRRGGVYEKGV